MLQDNSQKVFKQRIRSVLIGCAYGDAFGMAAEGMSFNAIHNAYPKGINEFLPSINHGISDRIFPAGSITDDTLHTFLLIDGLYEYKSKFTSEIYMRYLSDWYKSSPIADQVIGPSTLRAIEAYHQGKKNRSAEYAVSNGAIMKISPVGLIRNTKTTIRDLVCEVNKPTHNSNVCLSAACVTAYLISCFSRNEKGLKDLVPLTYEMIDFCQDIGFDMPSASLKARIELAMALLNESDVYTFSLRLSELIGTGINCTETPPCALAIVLYTNADIQETASICASIGGDTDTLGAIACSICGSLGYLPDDKEIEVLESVNQIRFDNYVDKIISIIETS